MMEGKDIVETAAEAGQFGTLVKAAQAAGLVETLKGEGPLTVFAPTDEAFNKLPRGTLDSLLKDKAKLASILKYHVVPGHLNARDVTTGRELHTAQGKDIHFDKGSGQIGGARITSPDIEASNGVVHVIDAVMMPP